MKPSESVVSIAAIAVMALPSQAAAQKAAAAASREPSTVEVKQAPLNSGFEDIVVTARRTEERLQSVPVSVVAFTQESLRAANVSSTEDLMVKTPGVFLMGSSSRVNTVFQIRGQSKAQAGNSAPAVISYFADVPSPNLASGIATYDLDSVQVLKGPQGTLFGRNTTGGAVLYYPVTPDYELGGSVEVQYGNYDERRLEAALNIPLMKDVAALRVAGLYEKRDGYTEVIGPIGAYDSTNARGFRASLLLEPGTSVKNVLIFDYFRDFGTNNANVLIEIDPNPGLIDAIGVRGPLTAELAAQQARGPRKFNSDIDGYQHVHRIGLTNRTDWDLGPVQLVNIFGYRNTKLRYNTNTDGVGILTSDGSVPGLEGVPFQLIDATLVSEVKQYSDEIQLHGTLFDGRLSWLLGGFYLKSKPVGPNGSVISVATVPGVSFTPFSYGFYEEESKAVFTNLAYDLGGGLKVNVGFRYTWDKINGCTAIGSTSEAVASEAECINGAASLTAASQNRVRTDAPTWQVGLDWQVTPDLFAYAVTRRGYRTGAVNSPTFSGRLRPYQTVDPETVTDIEIGVRSDWRVGDVRGRFNVSGFIGWYKGVQAPLSGVITNAAACNPSIPATLQPPISPDGDCDPGNDPNGGSLLINSGKSQVSGIDLEGTISPTEWLTLNFGGTILDLKTRSLDIPSELLPYAPPNNPQFNLVADKTFTAGFRIHNDLPNNLGAITLNADYYWSDDLIYTTTRLPSYDVVNARLEWSDVAGRPIDLSVFAKNLFDKEYLSTGGVAGVGLGWVSAVYGAPRMYGLGLRVRFGD